MSVAPRRLNSCHGDPPQQPGSPKTPEGGYKRFTDINTTGIMKGWPGHLGFSLVASFRCTIRWWVPKCFAFFITSPIPAGSHWLWHPPNWWPIEWLSPIPMDPEVWNPWNIKCWWSFASSLVLVGCILILHLVWLSTLQIFNIPLMTQQYRV